MRLVVLLVACVSLALAPATITAQKKKKSSEEDFVLEKPKIGDAFPSLTVYAPDGKEFKTSELQGHYSVLTFGCLT